MFVGINKGLIDGVHTNILVECSHVYFECQNEKDTITITAVLYDGSKKKFTTVRASNEETITVLNNQGEDINF